MKRRKCTRQKQSAGRKKWVKVACERDLHATFVGASFFFFSSCYSNTLVSCLISLEMKTWGGSNHERGKVFMFKITQTIRKAP